MQKGTPMSITIKENTNLIDEQGWDFPITEIDYLLEEHEGETFALKDDRLWECDPDKEVSRRPIKTIIIHDQDEKGYILDTIQIETNLDGERIQKAFDQAKAAAQKEYPYEWQTCDIIDRLPKEWNAKRLNDVEVWI